MLTSIEGVYENGVVHLLEPLPGVIRARVVVTVIPEMPAASPPHQTLRQMSVEERAAYLGQLREYWRGRLSSSEDFAQAKAEEIALENRRWAENP